MWDDFQIGDSVRVNTAVVIHPYDISHNDCEYWWRSQEYDISGKINKDSVHGKAIARMIARGVDPQQVEEYVFGLAMSNIPASTILAILKRVKKQAFEAGQRAKEAEFRSCLGLEY